MIRTMASARDLRRAAPRARAAVVAVVLAGLAACGAPSVEGLDAPVADAGGLVGLWRLEAADEPEGALLHLVGGDLYVVRPCVSLIGTWAARSGLFLADASEGPNGAYGHRGCPPEPDVDVPGWLTGVVRYASAGSGWRLLDAQGAAVATLRPGATFPENAKGNIVTGHLVGDGLDSRPDPEERARLNGKPAAPLPLGVRPAEPHELVARWEPEGRRPQCDRPYLDLRADGTWVGHDDEDDQRGRWIAGADGLALGTAAETMGSGCGSYEGEPVVDAGPSRVDAWMLRLARVGFRGERLVLLDADGAELASLTRRQAPDPADDIDDDGLSDSSGDATVRRRYTPPPRDPRRDGVDVAGGRKYLVGTSEHQFDLISEEDSTEDEWTFGEEILMVGSTGRAGKIQTGCAGGDVWLTVRAPASAPGPLAGAMKGWEVGEEATMTVESPLSVSELFGYRTDAAEIFSPTKPGRHRLRLLAKGRALEYDHVCWTPVESYELTIWPVDVEEPRVRRGDDGAGR
jgi:hypothetical protein